MTLFYLVRHAEIVRGFGDPGLTLRGEQQAAAVANYLLNKAAQCIYTSPLTRARQTAGIIAEILAAPLVVDARLRERINWGDTPGQTWAEFAAEWDRGDLDPAYIPRDGFSALQAAERLSDFIRDTAAKHPGGVVVAVTHAGIINDYLLAHIRPEMLEQVNPGWAALGSEIITHASVTTLRWTENGPALEGLADVAVK